MDWENACVFNCTLQALISLLATLLNDLFFFCFVRFAIGAGE